MENLFQQRANEILDEMTFGLNKQGSNGNTKKNTTELTDDDLQDRNVQRAVQKGDKKNLSRTLIKRRKLDQMRIKDEVQKLKSTSI